jgi:hypothetical protein
MKAMVAQCEQRDEQHKRELAGRLCRSEARQTNARWPGAEGVGVAFGAGVPIILTRKSIGPRLAIHQKEDQMNETETILRNFGISREQFDAHVKKACALRSPLPARPGAHFVEQPAADNGDDAKSVDIARSGGTAGAQHFRFAK